MGGSAGFGHALIVDPVRGCSVIFFALAGAGGWFSSNGQGQRRVALFGRMMHSGMLESYGGRQNMCFFQKKKVSSGEKYHALPSFIWERK
jgi:hypothetical protein